MHSRAVRGMRLIIAAAAILLILSPQPLFAHDSSRIARLKRDTKLLSSDELGGRAPLTHGEEKTTRFIEAEMRSAGLFPGAGTSFVQPVPLLQLETLRSPTPRFEVTGPPGTVKLEYGRDLTLNARRQASQVSLDNSELVFVGYGISAIDKDWDDYAGVDVRGKTVLILINDPDWKETSRKGRFEGSAMTYYGRWMYKYEEAARHGAAAAVIIHQDESAGYPFKVLTSSLAGARFSLDKGNTQKLAAEAWITRGAAQKVLALAGWTFADLERKASMPGFRAIPLGLSTSIHFRVASNKGVSKNVLGIVPGKRRPREYVLYTAHWDHLGRCPADKTGDDICNGAIDNATGVAGLLELARAYRRGPPPERSIVFLATTGEEYGLLGSEYYATHPVYPLARTVAEIDIDPLSFMLGRTRDVSMIADQTELTATVRDVAAKQRRIVTPDPAPELGSRYRSDTLSFARAGVPIIYMQGGIDVRDRPPGTGRAALGRYFEHDYHQPSDEYHEEWDWSGALEDLDLYYRVGRDLADRTDWPNWFAKDEFRGARDQVLEDWNSAH